MDLASRNENATFLLEAYRASGVVLLNRGEFKKSLDAFQKSINLYLENERFFNPLKYGFDAKAIVFSHLSQLSWLLGYPKRAIDYNNKALAWAKEQGHAPTLAHALEITTVFYALLSDDEGVLKNCDALLGVSEFYDLPFWRNTATFWNNWRVAKQRDMSRAVKEMQKFIGFYASKDALYLASFYQSQMVIFHEKMGDHSNGLILIEKSLRAINVSDEHWHEAELYRLQGQLILSQGKPDAESQAEISFQKSLTVARQQEAKSWELRTATNLAKLWHKQGNSRQALDLLTPVYQWFTEGFDTKDLKDAKALLKQLATASK